MEILQLADQCGVIAVTKHEWDGKRFNHTDDYLDGDGAGLVIFAKAIAEREREACAKIVENRILHDKNENIKKGYFYAQQSITQDIRARGQE